MQVKLYGIYNDVETEIPTSSGVGYYGNAFGYSILVGSFQDFTYLTNTAGDYQGSLLNNFKYNGTTTTLANGNNVNLSNIAAPSGLLKLSITHDFPIKVISPRLTIDDDISLSGVNCKLFEVFVNNTGIWSTNELDLSYSPGLSGIRASGEHDNPSATRHDWYCIASVSPKVVGSQNDFTLRFNYEYK